MKRVLITGMSGTGKSTVVAELRERGFRAVDMDEPGWSVSAPDGEWVWREDRVADLLLTDDTDVLFVAGCASNMRRFYPQFDEIILLTASQDLIVSRLESRTNNPFGKTSEELARVLADIGETEPKLARIADHEIDTSIPLGEVVARVLEISRLPPASNDRRNIAS
jgi:dephospho-CoA kinase